MTNTHPTFKHKCPVSFNKFDTSIEKVVKHTFSVLGFNPEQSYLPVYIGVEVQNADNPELMSTIRQFFERLRLVHQNHFVRFVTDTVWAEASMNGDIFYCHDGLKDARVDVMWDVKIVDLNRFEINITSVADNRRRDLLSHLESNLSTVFVPPDGREAVDVTQSIVAGFFAHTKNLSSLPFLEEDSHIVLVPSECGRLFKPVLICGLSSTDSKRRWRGIKGQLEYQKQMHTEYFTHKIGVGDLLNIPLELAAENGYRSDEGFCRRTSYEAVEQTLAILQATSAAESSSNDVIIFCRERTPKLNVTAEWYSFDFLAEHI